MAGSFVLARLGEDGTVVDQVGTMAAGSIEQRGASDETDALWNSLDKTDVIVRR
jgi:hypothetical protein